MVSDRPAFLFDLDGTLVDSVYEHVLAWRLALEEVGIELAVWRIHRHIGMSGGLFINALLRETGGGVTAEQVARIQSLHTQAYQDLARQVRPLPGARELLATLNTAGVPWAVATSGLWEVARPVLETLGIPEGVPIVRGIRWHMPNLIRISSWQPPSDWASISNQRSWSVTASGICWPRGGREHCGVGLLSGG